MRIIAGKYKGRLIQFPKQIRPTQDKVRQSIFDVLASVVKGSRVLDIFAGSGALGLEALSRGASGVWFIDIDRKCSLIIDKNLEKLGITKIDSVDIRNFTNDAFKAIKILQKKKERFDIVFLDPPYYKGLAKKALKTLAESGILARQSFVVVEYSKKDDLGVCPEGLIPKKVIDYGDIKVSFFLQQKAPRPKP